MKPNRLRQLLQEGKPSLGTHLLSPWPGLVEIVGHSGAFDYIEYVGEYSPFGLEQMDDWGRAVDLFPHLSAMFKIEEHGRAFFAPRAVDSGIQNLLFADCRSAAEVRECVRLVRAETPEAKGTHGAGMRRAVGYVLESGSPAWVQAMNDVVIAIMIEKKGAMDHLEEILSIEGVDMVQFGPTDYSISVGLAGQGRSDPIQQVHRRMIETALRMGVHPRVEIGSYEQAKPYLDLGVRHFCVGWDVVSLFAWCKREGAGMRELLASA